MSDVRELHNLIDAIPENRREEARVFLSGLLRRADAPPDEGTDHLDAIAADSELRKRFDRSIKGALERVDREGGIDAESVFKELMQGLPE